MSCTIRLIDELTGNPSSNGTWMQQSGPQNIAINQGYIGLINLTGVLQGIYVFRYSLPGTTATADVTINVESPPDAGSNTTITASEGDASIDLLASLDGTPDSGGVWTVDQNPPNGTVNLTNGTYLIGSGDGASSGITYTFTYTITKPNSDSDCLCCTKTATLAITVYDSISVGGSATVNVCANDI